jgi:hypothetical protein
MSTQERRELADERSEIELLLDAHDRAMWNWRALAERGCTTEEYNAADDARDATRKAIEDYFAVLRGEQPVESGQRHQFHTLAVGRTLCLHCGEPFSAVTFDKECTPTR